MTDAFALLEEPRQPWLEEAALKENFLNRSAATHPDKFSDPAQKAGASDRFAALNTAHDTLRDPKLRLRHLIELETGAPPADVHDIPPDTAELFLAVGQLLRPVDAFLTEREAQTSPLLRAQSYPAALDWQEQVNTLLATLNEQLADAKATLQKMNDNWTAAELESVYHQFSYLQKWRAQLNDRALRLGQ